LHLHGGRKMQTVAGTRSRKRLRMPEVIRSLPERGRMTLTAALPMNWNLPSARQQTSGQQNSPSRTGLMAKKQMRPPLPRNTAKSSLHTATVKMGHLKKQSQQQLDRGM